MIKRPERYRNAIVAHIYVDGAADGIAFSKRAFGAEELFRIAHPNGVAEMQRRGNAFLSDSRGPEGAFRP